ncbi:MAG: MBL fold metallo-hydrolase [Clostridia bacterium]|nr:MBL fold metallo-hydrolase [Clostridia bacterium]
MYITTLPIGPVSANCYIICDEKTKIGAVIDPGDFTPSLLKAIKDAGIEELKYILCTHGHFDHIQGVSRLKEKYPESEILIGEKDCVALSDSVVSLASFFGAPFYPTVADRVLNGGDKITIGEITFDVISAPGHSEGGVMYYSKDEKAIFTGDTIFKGSIGRTDFNGGSMTVLMNTLQKIKRLPEDVKIYSGHGEATTVKYETEYNMYLR